MLTTSEQAVTITIWILASAGAFFGSRAVRRRKNKRNDSFQATIRCD